MIWPGWFRSGIQLFNKCCFLTYPLSGIKFVGQKENVLTNDANKQVFYMP